MAPIINPPNPYIGPCKVYEGTLVTINGQARVNAIEFNINLQTGYQTNPRDDVALLFRCNFAQPRIIRSHIQNNQFGQIEDNGDPYKISPYGPFDIKILNEERNGRFLIAINNEHYCEFRHRIPTHAITCLAIDGDVDIHQINVNSPEPVAQQSPYPNPSPAMPVPMPMPVPQLYPSMPGMPSGPYPAAAPAGYPAGPASGPMPTAAYPAGPGGMPGIPQGQAGPAPTPAFPSGYPPQYPPAGQAYPQAQPTYNPYGQPQMPYGQPGPAQQAPRQSGPSSFLNSSGLGTIAGIGLGAAAGAAVLSAINPLKPIKKMMKPKIFGHHGYGRSSSSDSNSSFGSYSSNSS